MTFDYSILGLLGLTLVALGWIPQTIDTIKRRHSGLTMEFDVLYTLGSLSLMAYSIYINNLIFIALNAAATFMAAIGLYFKLIERKRGKEKKKIKKK